MRDTGTGSGAGAVDVAVSTALALMVSAIAVPRSHRRVGAVIDLVAWHTGLSRRDICGASRARDYFRARAAVCWVAIDLDMASTTAIGRLLGGRDHSTIGDARVRAVAMRECDPAFARMTDRIREYFLDLQED